MVAQTRARKAPAATILGLAAVALGIIGFVIVNEIDEIVNYPEPAAQHGDCFASTVRFRSFLGDVPEHQLVQLGLGEQFLQAGVLE